jgi:hypothetical protein
VGTTRTNDAERDHYSYPLLTRLRIINSSGVVGLAYPPVMWQTQVRFLPRVLLNGALLDKGTVEWRLFDYLIIWGREKLIAKERMGDYC